MGDAALTVDEALFNFQLGGFYQNWVQNIRDTQTPNGAVGDCTPLTFGGNPADPAWGTAYPTSVMALYDHYGDTVTARDHYPNLKAWVDFLTGMVKGSGIGRMYYHYGDWVTPPPYPNTNASLTSAASYAIDVLNLAKLAGVLGMVNDEIKYFTLFEEIGQAFQHAFWNTTTNNYVSPTLTANIFALAINAPPPQLQMKVLGNALNIINFANNHSTCGILGWRYLLPVLSDNGHHALALQIATQITYPSMGYMFNNPYENATTLWEVLNAPAQGPGMNSRNHIMFGSIGAWFYRYIGGIKPNAFEALEIAPAPVGPNSPVNSAQVSYNSIKGLISVNWKKSQKDFGMKVTIPSTTVARVVVPNHEYSYSRLMVNGITLADFTGDKPVYFENNLGIDRVLLQKDGSIEMRVQPGEYSFLASI
jgi:alpha-L-rhamnosidase